MLSAKELKTGVNKIKTLLSREGMTGNFMLFQENGCLNLSATDLDILAILHFKNTTIGLDDPVMVNGGQLVKVANQFVDESLNLRVSEEYLSVRSEGDSSFNIKLNLVAPGNDQAIFESKDVSKVTRRINMDSSDLLSMLSKLLFVVAQEDSRFTLNGVFVDHDHFVGCDGKALMKVKHELDFDSKKFEPFIVPLKAFGLFNKLCQNKKDIVEIIQNNNQTILKSEGFTIVANNVEGQYPDYNQVIPDDSEMMKICLDLDSNLKRLKKLCKLANVGNRQVIVFVNNGKVEVSTFENPEDADLEENDGIYAKIELDINPISTIPGCMTEPLKVGVNIDYLIGILTHIGSSDVQIGFSGGMGALLFEDMNDSKVIGVLMPMKI